MVPLSFELVRALKAEGSALDPNWHVPKKVIDGHRRAMISRAKHLMWRRGD
jgi:hypothetical protein